MLQIDKITNVKALISSHLNALIVCNTVLYFDLDFQIV